MSELTGPPSGVSGTGAHQIQPYDPEWARRAAEIEGRLRQILGTTALRIDHVGSTAVTGLGARPIPDIQVSVADITNRDLFHLALVASGYSHFPFPELAVDDYLVYVPADGSNTEHIEVCQAGSLQERRHLAVRDYLRHHPHEALAYEQVKREAAEAAGGRREVYSAGKYDFVHGLEQRALEWYGRVSLEESARSGGPVDGGADPETALTRNRRDLVTRPNRMETKRRWVRAFERYVQNPPIKLVLRLGLPQPLLALLETTGRNSGKPRRTPVLRGLVGEEFWIIAEHGLKSEYVKNLRQNPRVRIKIGRRWTTGTANVLVDDDPLARARWLHGRLGPWHRFDEAAARIFGTEPVTIRVDLVNGQL